MADLSYRGDTELTKNMLDPSNNPEAIKLLKRDYVLPYVHPFVG